MWPVIHEFINKHWILSLWAWLIAVLLVLNHLVHLWNKDHDDR